VTVTRLFGVAAVLHLAHLAEEALGGMHDDPIIVAAYAWLSPLGARHAAYLVFQLAFALGLVSTVSVARGGGAMRLVLAVFGLALVAEVHHPLRALFAGASNAGLVTSLPLPFVGALLVSRALSPLSPLSSLSSISPRTPLTRQGNLQCSRTSSSPWESDAS
jgi:hypothetical protein